VLTRDSAIACLSTVTVAPITSTIRGVPSEVVLNEEDGMKAPCAVNLHYALTISQNRLGRRVGQLSCFRMKEICLALGFRSDAISVKSRGMAVSVPKVIQWDEVADRFPCLRSKSRRA
jgi:mRNA interferase MazF